MDHTTSLIRRGRLLAGGAASIMALTLSGVVFQQYRAAETALGEDRASQRMMTAMLDQQTGLRGFALTRREEFLDPYRRGATEFDDAVTTARRLAGAQTDRRIDAQVVAAREWRTMAEEDLARWRVDPSARVFDDQEVARKRIFDRFRRLNAEFQAEVLHGSDDRLRHAGVLGGTVLLGLTVLFVLVGYVGIYLELTRLRRRREHGEEQRRSQAEFAETMQVMRDEREAHLLVKRYLERIVDGCHSTVINRNNSDNRLHAETSTSDTPELEELLRDATPESCVSIRLSRVFRRREGESPLLTCELCAGVPHALCMPSLVGGDVIGAVLVQHDRELQPEEVDRAVVTVVQSSPVLANLRNLALAEIRAATDALTGLPNARACNDTLKRMVAHAGRTLSPLSAVLLDLDHFKQVNDRYGHGAGDDVLAAVGAVLRATLRASDFAGRHGGEEFLILLPDTDHRTAMVVAERIRRAIAETRVARVEHAITASLGVASYPRDARDGDGLVRQADRALYAAKGAGRDRVELALSSDVGQHDAIDGPQETIAAPPSPS